MKAVFVHSMRFAQPDGVGGRLLAEGLTSGALRRYQNAFDEVVLMGREASPMDEPLGLKDDLAGNGVSFVSLPCLQSPKALLSGYLECRRRLIDTLNNADALIARVPAIQADIAVEVAKRLGKPYAVEVHGCGRDAYLHYGSIIGCLAARPAELSQRRSVRDAPFIIYQTKAFLQSRYPSKGSGSLGRHAKIGEGQYIAVASDVQLPEEGRHRVRPKPRTSSKIITLIGALANEYKGHRSAIICLSLLRQRGYKVRLRLIGPGDPSLWERLSSQNNVRNNIDFVGPVRDRKKMTELLEDTDIYIQPSLTEGLPRALIEAMALGCAAVGSQAGGIPELLDAEFLSQPGNPEDLALKLQMLLDDQNLWEAQQIRNRQKAQSYANKVLDPIRAQFWSAFAEYARKSG